MIEAARVGPTRFTASSSACVHVLMFFLPSARSPSLYPVPFSEPSVMRCSDSHSWSPPSRYSSSTSFAAVIRERGGAVRAAATTAAPSAAAAAAATAAAAGTAARAAATAASAATAARRAASAGRAAAGAAGTAAGTAAGSAAGSAAATAAGRRRRRSRPPSPPSAGGPQREDVWVQPVGGIADRAEREREAVLVREHQPDDLGLLVVVDVDAELERAVRGDLGAHR